MVSNVYYIFDTLVDFVFVTLPYYCKHNTCFIAIGAIINVSSISAVLNHATNKTHCMAKSAVNHMTTLFAKGIRFKNHVEMKLRLLYLECAAKGIRVNTAR